MKNEELAEGKRLYENTIRLRNAGAAICFRADAHTILGDWMIAHAADLFAAVEENATLRAEVAMWQSFAAYCRCCAQSGESDPMDFETFKKFLPANTAFPFPLESTGEPIS